MVTKHWLPVLREEGLLVECPVDQFTTQPGWVPLYTPESLTKYLPMALTAFPGSAPPSLMAVVPPPPASWKPRQGVPVDKFPSAYLPGEAVPHCGRGREGSWHFVPIVGLSTGMLTQRSVMSANTWTSSLSVELVISRATSVDMQFIDT